MEKNPCRSIPDTWDEKKNVHHNPHEKFGFHYHEVEERLKVTQGEMTFYPAGELKRPGQTRPFVCGENDVMHIPQVRLLPIF